MDAPHSGRGRWLASNGFGMFVLGVALALGGTVAAQTVARAIVASRASSSIKVKGTAQVDVESDQARWRASVSAKGATLEEAYQRLSQSTAALQQFMQERGFAPSECTVDAVDTTPMYARDEKGNTTNRVEFYTLRQSITVQTSKVQAVYEASNRVTDLIRQGMEVTSGAPQYTMATIEALKLTLLDDATRNAMSRAQTLAQGSGSRVGSLQSASQGVIQIVARGSPGTSDYNESDTSTIAKTVRAVVSLEYGVER